MTGPRPRSSAVVATGSRTDHPLDPPRALPTFSLFAGFAGLVALQGIAAFALARAFDWGEPTAWGIAIGGWTSLLVALLAIAALRPWQPRPMADWTVLWLGATTIRLLFTPVGLFSVYSAALFPGEAVFLGGMAAYLAALVVETAILGWAVLHPNAAAGSASSGGGTSDRPVP